MPKRILVAEDNAFNGKLLTRLLEAGGYEVDLVEDGEQAFEAVTRTSYDAILTDWMMPKMDGISLLRKVREYIKPAPLVVVVTSLNSEDARQHALTSGADDFLAKPYKHDRVVPFMKELFARRDQERAATADLVDSTSTGEEVPFCGVVLAANTGGPATLANLIPYLPTGDHVSYFIAQHSPQWVAQELWKRLQTRTSMPVSLAEEGMLVEGGRMYVAPGEHHLVIAPSGLSLSLLPRQPSHTVCPAGDPLLMSAARSFGRRALGVVLTGIGSDCVVGASHVFAASGAVLVQDPRSALAGSMPENVREANPDAIVLSPSSLPEAIKAHLDVLAEL